MLTDSKLLRGCVKLSISLSEIELAGDGLFQEFLVRRNYCISKSKKDSYSNQTRFCQPSPLRTKFRGNNMLLGQKLADAKSTTSYFLGLTFLGIIMSLSDLQ